MNKMKKYGGFTLIEVLIVMTLLAALALVVIAAINPVEQANRARDARFNGDSGQLLSAIERYYSTRSEFPWVTYGASSSNDVSFGFVTAGYAAIGVCGASCNVDGALITGDELKQEFRNRDFIRDYASTDNTKTIMVGKAVGQSASVYVCYVPLSKATRQKSCAESDVYTLNATTGVRTLVAPATCAAAAANWSTSGWHVCLPS